MASFKDLMKAFLYEEVEDEDDEIDEEPAASTPEKPVQTAPVQTVTPVTAAQPAQTPAAAPQTPAANTASASQSSPAAAQSMYTAPTAAPQSSLFQGLDMENIAAPEGTRPEAKPSNTPYRYDRRKISKPARRPVDNTEYQAVISPIFGNVEDSLKEYDAIHDAINLPKPEEDFEMTMVISPMFGNKAPEARPVESIPAYVPKKKKAAPAKEARKPARDLSDFLVREPAAPAASQPESEQTDPSNQ